MKRNALGALAGVLVCASFVVGGGSAAVAATCTLTPTLRDITVNQGLQTYPALARGKETLVRLYLSLPSCAVSGNSVQINKVTLTVSLKDAATSAAVGVPQSINPTPSLGSTRPQITNLFSSPPLTQMAPSDPVFIVPGSVIAPASDTNRLVATFSTSIDWQSVPAGQSGTGTALTSTTAGTAMTKTVEKQTRALRLLVVPMGGLLNAAGTTAIQNGMTTLSRLYPVQDGTGGSGIRVGSLTSTNGGIRYGLNNAYLDLSALGIALPFCGSATAFGQIDTQLSQFRQSWNSANPTYPADNVVGAIGESQSIASAANPNCDEARAAVNGREAWVRAISDKTTTLSAPMDVATTTLPVAPSVGFPASGTYSVLVDNEIMNVTAGQGTASWTVTRGAAATHSAGATVALLSSTGALLAMELEHNYGYVPLSRGDANYHSLYGHADHNIGDANRGYNVSARQYLPDNRSNMRFTPPGWTNLTGLLEPPDWADMLCVLGGATTSECATAGTAGTVTGTAAGLTDPIPVQSFVMSGTTDGTAAKTNVLESYIAATVPTPLVSSSYHLVQLAGVGGPPLRDDTVPVSFDVSNHNAAEPPTTSTVGLFSFAVPVNPSATRIEFRNGTTLLYGVNKTAAPRINAPIIPRRALSANRRQPVGGRVSAPKRQRRVIRTLASDPTAPFTQCPAVGLNQSCRLLIVYKADGSTVTLTDTGQAPTFDGSDDTLIGVQNDSGQTITSTAISAPLAFGFDGDGLCSLSITPRPEGCPFGSTGYEGPRTTFTSTSSNEGTANYTGDGLASGSSTYFSLEGAVDVTHIVVAPPHTLAVAKAGVGSGTVTSNPSGIDCGAVCSSQFADGTQVTLTATADPGFTFTGWSDPGCTGTGSCTVTLNSDTTVTATFDPAAIAYTVDDPNATSDLYLVCPGSSVYNVVRVALQGGNVSVPQTVGCTGGAFYAVAYSGGWGASPPTKVADSTLPNPPTLPLQPSATSPYPGQTYSVNDNISLVGSAFDYSTGTTATLQWFSGGNLIATGQQADVRASTLGPGGHTITLHATAGTNTADLNIPITISNDADGDGIPAPQELVIQACAPAGALPGDSDPTNGTKDYDHDGIPNRDDPFPCRPASSYAASAAIFLPNPLSLSGTGSLSAGGMYVPFRNMAQLIPPRGSLPNVFIKEIGLGEGGTIPLNEQASAYAAIGPFGGATFSRAPLIAALNANHIVNRSVTLTLTGTATDPLSGPWTFTAVVSTYITN